MSQVFNVLTKWRPVILVCVGIFLIRNVPVSPVFYVPAALLTMLLVCVGILYTIIILSGDRSVPPPSKAPTSDEGYKRNPYDISDMSLEEWKEVFKEADERKAMQEEYREKHGRNPPGFFEKLLGG